MSGQQAEVGEIAAVAGLTAEPLRDHRRDLWVGVVHGRISEAGAIDIGAACDHADYALSRFDRAFPKGAPK